MKAHESTLALFTQSDGGALPVWFSENYARGFEQPESNFNKKVSAARSSAPRGLPVCLRAGREVSGGMQ